MEKYFPPHATNNNQDTSIFVDATFCDESKSYATYFVIFDPGGLQIAAGFRKIKPPGTVLAAELQAIYDGIIYGEKYFSGNLRVSSDSVEAIHSVSSDV